VVPIETLAREVGMKRTAPLRQGSCGADMATCEDDALSVSA
jgi:hypothetical protein